MKAILMAAGVGSRISRFINKPKSTLTVDGEPLITKTVDMLQSKGVDVAVVVGYKKEEIKKALEGRNVTFYDNPFFRVTNSIASLWFAKDSLCDEDIIVANADVFWGDGLFDALMSMDKDVVMLGDESRVKLGDYFFNVKNGIIAAYGKELTPENRTTEYVGIAKIKSNMVEQFRNNLEMMIESEKYDLWWENVLYEHISETPVWVKDVSDIFWAEIDFIDDYMRIREYVKTKDISVKVKNEKI